MFTIQNSDNAFFIKERIIVNIQILIKGRDVFLMLWAEQY